MEKQNTYPSLQVGGPALVQPEVLPRSIGHEISTPAVGQFVSNDVDILSILVRVRSRVLVFDDRSNTLEMMLGVAKVKIGFSIPP